MTIVDITKFDSQRIVLVKYKIDSLRETVTDEQLTLILPNGWERGGRFNNTNRVIKTLLGSIYTACGFDIKEANLKFLSLNTVEIIPYIDKALVEAAGADYFYSCEKQYG